MTIAIVLLFPFIFNFDIEKQNRINNYKWDRVRLGAAIEFQFEMNAMKLSFRDFLFKS